MRTPAWKLLAWKPVAVTTDEWSVAAAQLRHVDTTCQVAEPLRGAPFDGPPLRGGQTIWVTALGREMVGLAWDWQEVTPGVVALSDPMSILTNLSLTLRGECLSRNEQLVALNTAVYRLRWQRVVSAALRAPGGLQGRQPPNPPPRLARAPARTLRAATAC